MLTNRELLPSLPAYCICMTPLSTESTAEIPTEWAPTALRNAASESVGKSGVLMNTETTGSALLPKSMSEVKFGTRVEMSPIAIRPCA